MVYRFFPPLKYWTFYVDYCEALILPMRRTRKVYVLPRTLRIITKIFKYSAFLLDDTRSMLARNIQSFRIFPRSFLCTFLSNTFYQKKKKKMGVRHEEILLSYLAPTLNRYSRMERSAKNAYIAYVNRAFKIFVYIIIDIRLS